MPSDRATEGLDAEQAKRAEGEKIPTSPIPLEIAPQDNPAPLLLFAVIGIGTAYLILTGRESQRVFLISDLVDPGAVSDISEALKGLDAQGMADEDTFVLSAWRMVGTGIPYEGFGSELTFSQERIRCERCLLPKETIARGKANCVGKAALLASILRGRIPVDRVVMAIGQVMARNGPGGHAWVEYKREGKWTIIEATKPPGLYPWEEANSVKPLYQAAVYFNDQYISCTSAHYCASIDKKSLPP